MSAHNPRIYPLRQDFTLACLDEEKLERVQGASLTIMEKVGVRFTSEEALTKFANHGADVDQETETVKISADLVKKAISTVPRSFTLGARDPDYDLRLGFEDRKT